MGIVNAQGQEIRKVSDDQIIMALNTLTRRNQAQQLQIMQLGLLIEFLIEKLGARQLPDGSSVFAVDETEYETWSTQRYEEIKAEASQFGELLEKKQAEQPVNLEE